MTNIDDRTFNEAFGVFQEFGPDRAIPRSKRLQDCFPSLSEKQVTDLIERFEEIESFAYDVAEQVRDGVIGRGKGKARIASQFPALDGNRLASTFSQAMYFSSK